MLELCEAEDNFTARSFEIRDATALERWRGKGDGKPLGGGTWPGGGPRPLGAMSRGEAANTALKVTLRLPGTPALFLERRGTPEPDGELPPRRTQGHATATISNTRLQHQAATPVAWSSSARRGEVGGGRRQEPGGTHGQRPARKASQGRAGYGDAAGATAAGWAERSGAHRPSGRRAPRLRRAGAGRGGARRGVGAQAAGFD